MNKKIRNVLVLLFLFIPIVSYSATVSFFLGRVRVYRNHRSIKVRSHMALKSGDIIKTFKNATIIIVYKDQSKITIKSNSYAKIGLKGIKNSDNISLISGNLIGKFTKLKKGKRKIYTPTTVCAIRGTKFTVSVSDSGNSRIALERGKLEINNPYGRVFINPNENSEIKVSEGPSKNNKKEDILRWQKEDNKKFHRNPKKVKEDYNSYLNNFQNRNSKTNKKMKNFENKLDTVKDKEKLQKAENDIKNFEEEVIDDTFLNDSSNQKLKKIVDNYKRRNRSLYYQFKNLRRKSNRVKQQQLKNYEELQKIRKKYKEAYDKIINKFKSDKEKILNGVNLKKFNSDLK